MLRPTKSCLENPIELVHDFVLWIYQVLNAPSKLNLLSASNIPRATLMPNYHALQTCNSMTTKSYARISITSILTYDLLEDRRAIDVTIKKFFPPVF